MDAKIDERGMLVITCNNNTDYNELLHWYHDSEKVQTWMTVSIRMVLF